MFFILEQSIFFATIYTVNDHLQFDAPDPTKSKKIQDDLDKIDKKRMENEKTFNEEKSKFEAKRKEHVEAIEKMVKSVGVSSVIDAETHKVKLKEAFNGFCKDIFAKINEFSLLEASMNKKLQPLLKEKKYEEATQETNNRKKLICDKCDEILNFLESLKGELVSYFNSKVFKTEYDNNKLDKAKEIDEDCDDLIEAFETYVDEFKNNTEEFTNVLLDGLKYDKECAGISNKTRYIILGVCLFFAVCVFAGAFYISYGLKKKRKEKEAKEEEQRRIEYEALGYTNTGATGYLENGHNNGYHLNYHNDQEYLEEEKNRNN